MIKEKFHEILERVQSAPNFECYTWNSPESSTQDLSQLFRNIVQKELESLEGDLRQRLEEEFFGQGPLFQLNLQEGINEILVTSNQQVYIEKQGHVQKWHDHFLSELTYEQFIHRICRDINSYLTIEKPFASGLWCGYRVQLVGPPVISGLPILSLRHHPQSSFTLEVLQQNNWATSHQIEILNQVIQNKENTLIIGPTSSGKTTLLNALLQETPENERWLILEDADEIRVPNEISQKLLTRQEGHESLPDISLSDLVKQSLRLRPDRLALGEVRGEEAKNLLMALSTGHRGSIGTLHADNVQQGIMRLEMLTQMGAPQWSSETVKKLILTSIDILIVLGISHKQRTLKGIYRLTGLEPTGFLIEELT